MFSEVPKQSANNNRKLIEDVFPHALAYEPATANAAARIVRVFAVAFVSISAFQSYVSPVMKWQRIGRIRACLSSGVARISLCANH